MKRFEKLSNAYVLKNGDDCLCQRTNPGTPVGEHGYSFCGCHVSDAFIAGYRQAILDAASVADDNARDNSRWADHYRTKEPNTDLAAQCFFGECVAINIYHEIKEILEREE